MQTKRVGHINETAPELLKLIRQKLHDNCVLVLLSGDLGAGKTTLVQEIGKSLGITHMPSPSYVYMCEYDHGESKIVHVDLWRVEDQKDFEALELGQYFEKGNLILVEWPKDFLVKEYLDKAEVIRVNIAEAGEGREVEINEER